MALVAVFGYSIFDENFLSSCFNGSLLVTQIGTRLVVLTDRMDFLAGKTLAAWNAIIAACRDTALSSADESHAISIGPRFCFAKHANCCFGSIHELWSCD